MDPQLFKFILFLFLIICPGIGLTVYSSKAHSSRAINLDGYQIYRYENCTTDILIKPIFGYNDGLYFINNPVNITYTKIYYINDSRIIVYLNLLVVPSPEIKNQIIVKNITWKVENFDNIFKMNIGGILEVPSNSIAIRIYYWVAGHLYYNVRDLGNRKLAVSLVLEDLRMVSESSIKIMMNSKLDVPERLQYLNLTFIVEPEQGRVYVVSEDNKMYIIGEKLPFFPYPEVFSPYILVKELYINTFHSLERLAKEPKPLELLVKKVNSVEDIKQKMNLSYSFADTIFKQSKPSFTYLGYICQIDYSGLDNTSIIVSCSRESPEKRIPLILAPSGNEDVSKLFEALKIGDNRNIRDFLAEFFTLKEFNQDLNENEPTMLLRFSGPLPFKPFSIVLVPLPPGNPWNTSYAKIYIYPKGYACNILDLVRELINGTKYSIDDVEYNLVNDSMLEIIDRTTGKIIITANYPASINGTDGIIYTGDTVIVNLYSQAMDSWKLNNYKVGRAFLEVRNFLGKFVWKVTSQGLENMDFKEEMSTFENMMNNTLAELWPKDPLSAYGATMTSTGGFGGTTSTAQGYPGLQGSIASDKLIFLILFIVIITVVMLAYYLRGEKA